MKRLLCLILLSTNIYASGWQCINRNGVIPTCNTWRWLVPHGWLIEIDNDDRSTSVTFYPDENHEWKV